MKMFNAELEDRREETRHKGELAKEALRTQIGLTPDVVFLVREKRLSKIKGELESLAYYLEEAFSKRPDVKLVETGVDARKDLYELEKKKMYPDLGIGSYFEIGRTAHDIAGLTATDDFTDPFNFTRAGIGMRLSGKFDFHGSNARIKSAKSDYFKANLEGMMARDGIRLDVQKSYFEAKNSAEYFDRMKAAQKLSRQLLFFEQSNYDIGIGDQKDYVEAIKNVLLNRGKYLESIYRYNVSLAELDKTIGNMPEFGGKAQ
jgi:outer membrane protein TolC